MKLLFTILLLTWLSGCASKPLLFAQDDERQSELFLSDYLSEKDVFFASFQILEKAHTAEPEKYFSGIKYYLYDGRGGNYIDGFYFKDGELIDNFSFCCSDEDYKTLKDIDFEYFDYKSEKVKANRVFKKALDKKFKKTGEITVLGGRDGNRWRIKINTEQGIFNITRNDSSGEINNLANHSEKIAKLKKIIDFLALGTGRVQLGFY